MRDVSPDAHREQFLCAGSTSACAERGAAKKMSDAPPNITRGTEKLALRD